MTTTPQPNDQMADDDYRRPLQLIVTARSCDVLVGLEHATDAITMDAESALRLAAALQDAAMMVLEDPGGPKH